MQRLLGAESDALLAALESPPVAGLRVNTLKLAAREFERLAPWPLTAVPWCTDGYAIGDETGAGKHPYHAAGLYYLQEPSAMSVVAALNPQPGEWVLDLAAAPGGKATQIAARLAGDGLLVANDIDARRARVVAQNLERCGVRNAVVVSAEPAVLAERWGAVFDRVLFDAPCSGEGMFRKSESARTDWSEAHVRGCAVRQAHGLDAAARLVRRGGWLAYSTCTFAPEEDEQSIAGFLDRHADFEVVPCELTGTDAGHAEWLAEDDRRHDDALAQTRRIWPHRARGEGHFVALLRRASGDAVERQYREMDEPPRRLLSAWQEFQAASLGSQSWAGVRLEARESRLAATPRQTPPLDGIRVVELGCPLGDVSTGRFEPAHALALALRRDETAQMPGARLDFAADDEALRRYLHGHPLEAGGPDGWVLLSVAGFPLGWGRRSQGIVKNRYPKGLRIA
ncbi:MAG: RsmF rRNA methyltransferase first C-terminal domain-containing protein [Chloroflexi bacterium]|nr:RsmF rRNA methyltransferase first C-terminal domain-containing protein [Chloroflexota bacterium]